MLQPDLRLLRGNREVWIERRQQSEVYDRWTEVSLQEAIASQTPLCSAAWTGSCQTAPACLDTETPDNQYQGISYQY